METNQYNQVINILNAHNSTSFTLDKLAEECVELAHAIIRQHTKYGEPTDPNANVTKQFSIDDVVSEMADVFIRIMAAVLQLNLEDKMSIALQKKAEKLISYEGRYQEF